MDEGVTFHTQAFALFLAAAILFGYHIHIEGELYTGLMYENYMTRLSWNDLTAWAVLSIVFAACLDRALIFLDGKTKRWGFAMDEA